MWLWNKINDIWSWSSQNSKLAWLDGRHKTPLTSWHITDYQPTTTSQWVQSYVRVCIRLGWRVLWTADRASLRHFESEAAAGSKSEQYRCHHQELCSAGEIRPSTPITLSRAFPILDNFLLVRSSPEYKYEMEDSIKYIYNIVQI